MGTESTAHTPLTFIAGHELPPVGLQVWGDDVAEAVGQDVLRLVVDVLPAVRACLNRSCHIIIDPGLQESPPAKAEHAEHCLTLHPLFPDRVPSHCYLLQLPDLLW